MTKENWVLKELSLLCEQMDVRSIENSAPKTARFGDLLMNDSILIPISNEMYEQELEDREPINRILGLFAGKLYPICRAIVKHVRDNKIHIPQLAGDLHSLEYRERDNSNALFLQYVSIKKILKALLQDHREFVKKFAEIRTENGELRIFLSQDIEDLIKDYQEESFRLGRIEKTKDWYAFRQIVNFCIFYDPAIYKRLKSTARNKHFSNALYLDVGYEALKRAIGPIKDNPNIREMGFDPYDYKMHMQRALLCIQRKLNDSVISNQTHKSIKWGYDSKKHIFTSFEGDNKLGEKKFRDFRVPEDRADNKRKSRDTYGLSSAILKIITKDAKSMKTKHSSTLLYENITHSGTDTDGGRAIYDSCKHINAMLLEKCFLPDFLIFDMNFVQVNPLYLN